MLARAGQDPSTFVRMPPSLLSGSEHARSKALVDAKPCGANLIRNPLLLEHEVENVVAAIEMAWKKGQAGVRFRQGRAVITLRAAQKAACQGQLRFYDATLVLSLKEKPHHRVLEQAVVQLNQHGQDP
jgi:hypothetical protein